MRWEFRRMHWYISGCKIIKKIDVSYRFSCFYAILLLFSIVLIVFYIVELHFYCFSIRKNSNNLVFRSPCTIFGFAEDRRRLGKENKNFVIYFAFRSPCTTLPLCGEDRLRLGKTQINLVFRSPCTIFAKNRYYYGKRKKRRQTHEQETSDRGTCGVVSVDAR